MKKRDRKTDLSNVNMDDLKVNLTDETKKGLKGLRLFIEYWDSDLKPYIINFIQPAFPYYVSLSQIEEQIARFTTNNNIIAEEKGDEIFYTYKDKSKLKVADKKTLDAFLLQKTRAEDEIFKKFSFQYFMAVHFLSEMMTDVDTEISNFRNPATKMIRVYGNFSDDKYYEMLLKEDPDCKEIPSYKEIAKKIEYCFGILKEVK